MVAPDNPVLAELWRGEGIESQHRGLWVLADRAGTALDGRGHPSQPVYTRSSTKSLQALPFVESGAADALGAEPDEIAVTIASHSAEPVHVAAVQRLLDRAGLDESALQCGPQRPMRIDSAGGSSGGSTDGSGEVDEARRIHNNCSGKHAAFLATAVHLGDDPDRYLDPASRVQIRARGAVAAMTGVPGTSLGAAIDGCSAPTFRMPLVGLATAMARMATPDELVKKRPGACRRIIEAAAAHPVLVGGSNGRLDTDLLRATGGRVFAKGGAEGVMAMGFCGTGLGLAVKIDDGSPRGYERFVVELLLAIGQLSSSEAEELASWRDPVRRNWDGLDIGRHVIPEAAIPQ